MSNGSTLLDSRVEKIISGQIQPISLAWPLISAWTNCLIPGDIMLFCGAGGSSKSLAILQCLLFWHSECIKACIYELEDLKEYHLLRLLAQRRGNPGLAEYRWMKENPEDVREVLSDEENRDFINEISQMIYASNEGTPTLVTMLEWIRARADEGNRIIVIDPISVAQHVTDKAWDEDANFLGAVEKITNQYNCSVLFVTHPKKNSGKSPNMDDLAGSAAYARLAKVILWLQFHDAKISKVQSKSSSCGTTTEELSHNRTMHILKARNGKGNGLKLAYSFVEEKMGLTEHGLIIKK